MFKNSQLVGVASGSRDSTGWKSGLAKEMEIHRLDSFSDDSTLLEIIHFTQLFYEKEKKNY